MNSKHDLTTGKVRTRLLAFAFPIFLVNILQALYNMVDLAIVGHYVGPAGMAAVNNGGQVTNMVLMVCLGLANGCTVLTGQLYGSGKAKEIRRLTGSFLSFLILAALILTAASVLFMNPLLALLNTPAESLGETRSYLLICMCGTVFVYAFNALSASLRGIGISFILMIISIITTAENFLLDLLFVGVFDLRSAGAAAATVTSQLTALVLAAVYIRRKTQLFDFSLSSFRIDKSKLKAALRIGFPQSLQFTCTTVSFLCIAALINSYGVDAAAAASVTLKVGNFGLISGTSFMSALMTLTAQNHPGRQYKRILQGMFWGMFFSLLISGTAFILCRVIPGPIYGLFTDSAAVTALGIPFLKWYSICFFDEVIMFCMFGVLTGAGYTRVTMLCSIFSAFGVRYAAALLLSTYTAMGFNGIAFAYVLSPLVGLSISLYFLISGKWKYSKVRI